MQEQKIQHRSNNGHSHFGYADVWPVTVGQ